MYKLSVGDRMNLQAILPAQGDYQQLILIKDIKAKLELTQEEMDQVEFKAVPSPAGTQFQWNTELSKEMDIEVDFSKLESNLIVEQLKEKSTKKTLTPRLLDAYEMFVNNNIEEN